MPANLSAFKMQLFVLLVYLTSLFTSPSQLRFLIFTLNTSTVLNVTKKQSIAGISEQMIKDTFMLNLGDQFNTKLTLAV